MPKTLHVSPDNSFLYYSITYCCCLKMEETKAKSRRKIKIEKINDFNSRVITFSKRKARIYKKANEITTLCGANIGMVMFSPTGRPFSYASPSMESIANRFFNQNLGSNGSNSIMESCRQNRIDELIKECGELETQVGEAKLKEKELRKMIKGRKNDKKWWETPPHELTLQELKQMDARMEELRKTLSNYMHGRTLGASSSCPGTSKGEP